MIQEKTSSSFFSSLFLILLTISVLITTSCSNLTPTENGLLAGGLAGAATGIALGASGVNSGVTIPTALGAAVLAGGGTYLYSKHRATIEQRRIAEARARLYYAQLNQQEQSNTNRYLAVRTPDANDTQGRSVMLYDTRTGQAQDNVYDVRSTPAIGASTTIDNTPATYIGNGQ
jgi:hypothetical protein